MSAKHGFEITTGKILRQGLFEESSTAKHRLGTRMQLADGRVFYYAKSGGTLAGGKLCAAKQCQANHMNQSVAAAAAVGDKSVSLTVGATAVTANEYAEGWLHINDAAGEGHQYKIKRHPAVSASGTATFYLYDPIQVALTTSSEFTLVYNPFYGVAHTATEENVFVGIPPMAVTSGYYFWIQTWGPAIVLATTTAAVGNELIPGATAGSVGYYSVTTQAAVQFTKPTVGVQMGTAGVDTEYKPIFLMLLP